MEKYIKLVLLFAALSVGSNLFAQSGSGNVYLYHSTGTNYYRFQTIYAAVNNTQSGWTLADGDRIVLNGNTNEPNTVVITKDITITSNNTTVRTVSPARTGGNYETLNDSGTDNRCLFRIDPGADVILDGSVTFSGTYTGMGTTRTPNISVFRVKDNPSTWSARNKASLTINSANVTITGGHGALMVEHNGTGDATKSQFNAGGGIWIDGGNVILNAGKITGNSANYGGAIFMSSNNGTFTMNGGYISDNTAIYKYDGNTTSFLATGAGICCYAGTKNTTDISITGGEISGNKLEPIKNGAVYHDKKYANGGAMYCYNAKVSITGGSIINNETLAVNQAWYDGNESKFTNGGGIGAYGGTLTISPATGKTITLSGNKSDRGGFLYISHDCVANISNVTIANNTSTSNAGAVFTERSAADTPKDPTFNFKNVTFDNNKTEYGGGGAFWVYGCDEASIIQDCTFTNNYARWSGGAIYVENTLQPRFHIKNLTTSGNRSQNEWVWNEDWYKTWDKDGKGGGGNVLNIDDEIWGGKYPTVYISGTFNVAEDHAVYLSGQTYLTKEGTFSVTGSKSKLDVVVDNHYSEFPEAVVDHWHVFSGRDVLATKNDASQAVTAADLDLLHVEIRNPYLEEYGFYLRPVYNASGFDNKGITTSKKNVIELQGLGMIRITRSGLKAGESAIYNITKQGNTEVLYTVQVTGEESNPTPTNEVIYVVPDNYTVTENGWDWAYNKGTNPQTKTVTNIASTDKKIPWTVYAFTGDEKAGAVKPHDESQATKGAGKPTE